MSEVSCPLGQSIPGWDYDFKANLRRVMQINVGKIREELGHDQSECIYRLLVMVETGKNRKRRYVLSDIAVTGETWESDLELSLKSFRYSGGLRIRTELILASDLRLNDALSPQKMGSRIWDDEFVVDLEGEFGAFPMESVSFNAVFSNSNQKNGFWYLHWNPKDWSRSFLGHVRLYLNSDNKDFVTSISTGDPVAIGLLTYGVVNQLCSAALDSDEFIECFDEFEEGSTGHTVSGWLNSIFSEDAILSVAQMKKDDPARFESILQNGMKC